MTFRKLASREIIQFGNVFNLVTVAGNEIYHIFQDFDVTTLINDEKLFKLTCDLLKYFCFYIKSLASIQKASRK